MSELSVEAALRKAGYRARSVANADELSQAFRDGGWQVVLVDLADAPAASARVMDGGGAVVLPVALNPTADDLRRARTRYARVVLDPSRSQRFVDAVDDAVESELTPRPKGAVGKSR